MKSISYAPFEREKVKRGMRTKLQAATLATGQGIDTIISNGKNPEALYDIVKGDSVGTFFLGKG